MTLLQVAKGYCHKSNLAPQNVQSTTVNRLPLLEILQQLQEQKQVNFLYEAETLKDVFIATAFDQNASVPNILNRILPPVGLTFKQVGAHNFIIKQIEKKTFLSKNIPTTEKIISGKITDVSGNPVIGVNIVEDGTTNGTTSDLNGNYRLPISNKNGQLIYSYTGYEATRKNITGRSKIDLILQEGIALSEVLVTGYGTVLKEALVGSAVSVKKEQFEFMPFASFEQSLQGNVAGLQAVVGTGQPGANAQIRIRGQGSISASSEPLYVLDGLPIPANDLTEDVETGNPLSTLSPNEIESVTILKDAASTAIFGARAANGVILITTKKGQEQTPTIRLNMQLGFNDLAVAKKKRLRGLTSKEYTDLYLEGYQNRGWSLAEAAEQFNRTYLDPSSGKPAVDIQLQEDGNYTLGEVRVESNWLDEITRIGLNQNYDLSLSGGNKNLTYFASASYFQQEAPIIHSELDRYASRLNLYFQPSSKLKIRNNISLSRTYQQGMNDDSRWANPMYNSYLLPPVIPIKNPDGSYYFDHRSLLLSGNNPVGSLRGEDSHEWTIIRIMDNLSVEYKLAKNLTIQSAWAVDLLNYQEFYFRNARYGDGNRVGGIGSETIKNRGSWIGTNTLNYQKKLQERHHFNFLLGQEAQRAQQRTVRASGEQFPPHQNLRTLENAATGRPGTSSKTATAFTSLFTRTHYHYDYKYYGMLSLRRDGSSRFGSRNRYGTFWSLGAAWRLEQESFLKNNTIINQLKLRSSYGITGNAAIGDFESQALISFDSDYDNTTAAAFSNIGNERLTWEKNAIFNLGLDFSLFCGKLNGTIEYFHRTSSNLLLDVPISRTTGFRSITKNFAAMQNVGLELDLNTQLYQSESFSILFGGNITFLKNEITDLQEPFRAGANNRFLRHEGRDFNEYHVFDWAGVDSENGLPLWYTDASRTQTTSDISEATSFFIGKSGTPDFYGGLYVKLSLRNFYLHSHFNYTWNNWLYDDTAPGLQNDGRFTPRSQTNLVLHRWQQPGDVTNVPAFAWGNPSKSNHRRSSRWIHDGTHIRFRNLTLAYQLPESIKEKLKLQNAQLYLRGTNLWTWTRQKDLYLDPEAEINGFVNSPVPNFKTLALGFDVRF
ncbi:MAG: SusC/RagA family TonB-linked outer membrane protein [Bacteroidota bacterium]